MLVLSLEHWHHVMFVEVFESLDEFGVRILFDQLLERLVDFVNDGSFVTTSGKCVRVFRDVTYTHSVVKLTPIWDFEEIV